MRALAVVSVYGAPDNAILKKSYQALWVHEHGGEDSTRVIDVKDIVSVVGMVPFENTGKPDLFYLVEKFGLDVGVLSGEREEIHND